MHLIDLPFLLQSHWQTTLAATSKVLKKISHIMDIGDFCNILMKFKILSSVKRHRISDRREMRSHDTFWLCCVWHREKKKNITHTHCL